MQNKQTTRKSNPSITWKTLKAGNIGSFEGIGCDLTAEEFVKRARKNPDCHDEDFIVARDTLLEQCRRESYPYAYGARCVLEKAGYDKRIIPQEAYDLKNRDYDPLLHRCKQNPIWFIKQIEKRKEEIKPFFRNPVWFVIQIENNFFRKTFLKHGLKHKQAEELLKQVFEMIVGREMTLKELEEAKKLLKQSSRSIIRIALFLWACTNGKCYKTVIKLWNKVSETRRKIKGRSPEVIADMEASLDISLISFFLF